MHGSMEVNREEDGKEEEPVQSDVAEAGSASETDVEPEIETEVEAERAVGDVLMQTAQVDEKSRGDEAKTTKRYNEDDEDHGLAYGIAEGIGDEDEVQDLEGLDYGEALSRVSTIRDVPPIDITERSIDIGLVYAGHAIEETSGSDTEVADDTSNDGYDADSSEAEPGDGPAFNRTRYGEVTGGISEISLFDTAVCVGFGYALVYAV